MVINGAYMMGDRPEAIGSRLEGSAGEMLWKMLQAIHVTPHETYLTHAIRCPVNGRPPRDAVLRCSEWLRQEIKLIQPKVIILLGPFAGATLFPNASAATTAVGRWSLFDNIPCITLHHPMRIEMLADLAIAMKKENWKALQAVQAHLEKE
jgi:DNA polymerase